MNFIKWVTKAKEDVREANKEGIGLSKFSSNVEERALLEYYTHYDLIKKTWWLTIATWVLAIATIIFIFVAR